MPTLTNKQTNKKRRRKQLSHPQPPQKKGNLQGRKEKKKGKKFKKEATCHPLPRKSK